MPQALLGRFFDRSRRRRERRATGPPRDQGVAPKAKTEDEVLSEFRASHALLEGHFKLSSGRHSAYYLQCARVLMNAERAGALARALVQKIPREIRSQIE